LFRFSCATLSQDRALGISIAPQETLITFGGDSSARILKYPLVLQHSEEDCGAACIATVLKYYSRIISLNRVREAVGTRQQGTTLLGLRRGGEAFGFNARQVKVTKELVDRLNEAPLPAIIHWKGYHWVVLYGQKKDKYVIADPAVGVRYLSRPELDEGWSNGIMLLLMPDRAACLSRSVWDTECNRARFSKQPDEERLQGFSHFLGRILPYRQILLRAIALNLLIGLLSLASPFLVQILTDDVLVRRDRQLLTTVAIGVIAINLFSNFCQLIQSKIIAHFAQRIKLELVLEFGRQILRLPLNYYQTRRSGEVVSRLQDIEEINQLISQVAIALPSQTFIGLISLGLMLFYSIRLTAVAVAITVLMTLPIVLSIPILKQKTRSLLVNDAENQGFLVETFKGAITLKTSNAAPQAWEELQSRFGRLANLTFRTIEININNNFISRLISGIGTVVVLWFGSSLVIDRQLSIGQLLAFNSMNANFIALISYLINFIDRFTFAQTAIERIQEVIETTPENDDDNKPWLEIPGNVDLVCTKLNYYYPGRLELFEDFSISIPGGKITALIGQSGCGKSTLAKLIAGLYRLRSGSINFGSYAQRDISLECLRQQVVLVPQEAQFWSRSILDNFRFSHPFLSFEEIVSACKIVGANEFIEQLPDGYQTILGEFGANISGGQRQRLAIARAIATDPPILILDESTVALDPVSETQVLDKLLRSRQGKTTILITHRSRVISRADWIILLDKGKLQQQGSLSEMRSIPGAHRDFLLGG
jgi:ATP-binding cassette, subfamily C, bacterial